MPGERDELPAELKAVGFRDVQRTMASLLLRCSTLAAFPESYIEVSPLSEMGRS